MNVIMIPFHDWRKSESEGFRTRDVHLIRAIGRNEDTNGILVVNRPTTWLELIYKRHKKELIGERILKKDFFSLTKVGHNIYVTDYHSNDIFGQLLKKHLWFITKYNDEAYLKFIQSCLDYLNFNDPHLIVQNVFAYRLAASLQVGKKVFDAWDNFLKFPSYISFRPQLEQGYQKLACEISKWSTNSNENIDYYRKKFNVKNLLLLKNGVKTTFMDGEWVLPQDMQRIKKPIIGFGGKITYLLNHELINHITAEHPDKSFVFVGQILDQVVYQKIIKRDNVHFLGDKSYEIYPNYVKNFDICIVPYHVSEGQHGGDSMKAYEYLLTGKKVVGTYGNGLQDLKEYLYLAETSERFSFELNDTHNEKALLDVKAHSWDSKATDLIRFLKE